MGLQKQRRKSGGVSFPPLIWSYPRYTHLTLDRGFPWIDCMENFSTFLLNIQPDAKFKPIKIAIIHDDGVDITDKNISSRPVQGVSFRQTLIDRFHSVEPFWRNSGMDGNMIATILCKICPKPQLYIVRVEECVAEGGGRYISVTSAAQVPPIPLKMHPTILFETQ